MCIVRYPNKMFETNFKDFMVNETMVKKECLCPMKCLKTTPTTLSAICSSLMCFFMFPRIVNFLRHSPHLYGSHVTKCVSKYVSNVVHTYIFNLYLLYWMSHLMSTAMSAKHILVLFTKENMRFKIICCCKLIHKSLKLKKCNVPTENLS